MKRILPIKNVPNQEFSFGASDYEVFVTIFSVYGLLCAQVSIDDELVCSSAKCINGISFIPKSAEKKLKGKLYFETDGSYPSASIVGTENCKLIFEDSDE